MANEHQREASLAGLVSHWMGIRCTACMRPIDGCCTDSTCNEKGAMCGIRGVEKALRERATNDSKSMPEVRWCYDEHGQVFQYCDPKEVQEALARHPSLPGVVTLSAEEARRVRHALSSAQGIVERVGLGIALGEIIDALSIITRAQKEG